MECILILTGKESLDMVADANGLHVLLVEFWEDEEGETETKELYYTKSPDQGST